MGALRSTWYQVTDRGRKRGKVNLQMNKRNMMTKGKHLLEKGKTC